MRHTSLCPLRWADLDELGHVNNVVYVDYLQEARVHLLRLLRPQAPVGGAEEAGSGEGAVVVRHEITYLAPLLLDRGDLHVECWVTRVRAASFTLAYELFHPLDATEAGPSADTGPDGAPRRVYARATTVLTPFVFTSGRPRRLHPGEREVLETFLEPDDGRPVERAGAVDPARASHFPVQVRFSDVDVYRHVNNVKYVEYLQEARISLSRGLWRREDGRPDDEAADGTLLGLVVAQTDVDYTVPMVLRPEPYDVWTVVARLGRTSMALDSEIRDGDRVCARARATLVFWDRAAGRSMAPPRRVRERLEAVMAG